jgi:GNAT superfamily N-acetyltransferase
MRLVDDTRGGTFLWQRVMLRTPYLVYATALPPPAARMTASVPIDYRENSAEGFRHMFVGRARYGLSPGMARKLQAAVAGGAICQTGWSGAELVWYAMIHFNAHRFARNAVLPLAPHTAYLSHGFTREDYRGRGVCRGGLNYALHWLAGRGYRRALLDVTPWNAASIRAIEQNGMTLRSAFCFHRVLGWRWASFPGSLPRELLAE